MPSPASRVFTAKQNLFHIHPSRLPPLSQSAILPADIRSASESLLREAVIAATETVPAPTAFLANPSHGQVDLVGDLNRRRRRLFVTTNRLERLIAADAIIGERSQPVNG